MIFRSKEDMARELLDLMGAKDKYKKIAKKMADEYSIYGIGDIISDAAFESIDELVESTIGIYCRQLDKKTLKGILRFYKSDLGQSFMCSNARIDEELLLLATEWNTKVLNKANNILLKRKVENGVNPMDYIPKLDV